MGNSEKSIQIQAIVKALQEKGVSAPVIMRIEEALSNATLRPLRVLYECCVNDGVSTETLTSKYGYNQPPRAARDVRELGFNLKSTVGRTQDGRRMAVYSIDNFDSFSAKEGRQLFAKQEKTALFSRHSGKCFYCSGGFSSSELQIDHRIPFEIVGNKLHAEEGLDALILVCSSCNRSKSWSCESCENFSKKNEDQCRKCYWFDPDNYLHVGGKKRALVNVAFDETDAGFKKFFGRDRAAIKKIIEN